MSHLQKDRDRNWRILRNGHYHEWLELMKLLTDVACFFPCRIIKAKKYEGVSNCIIPYCQNEKRLDAGNIYIYIYSSWNLFPCLITGKLTLTLYHLLQQKKKLYIIYRLAENLVGSVVQHYMSLLFHMGTAFRRLTL